MGIWRTNKVIDFHQIEDNNRKVNLRWEQSKKDKQKLKDKFRSKRRVKK